MHRWTTWSVGLLIVISSVAGADEAKPTAPVTETVKLTLHPSQNPILGRFRLDFDRDEQRDGNAAIDLYKAILLATEAAKDGKFADFDPFEIDAEMTRQIVDQNRRVFAYLDYAARCRNCDWQIPWLEESPFSILLPELQRFRGLQRLLIAKCRRETHEGRLVDAVKTLRTAFHVSRHAASGPTLIHGLVGVAMGMQAVRQMEQLVQHPQCPSLQRGLLSLPRPFIDLREALSFERNAVGRQFPQLERLRGTITAEEANRLGAELLAEVQTLMAEKPTPVQDVLKTLVASTEVPAAKQRLREAGYTPNRVAAMPAPQVLLLDSYELFLRQHNLARCWYDLPLPVALSRQAELEKEMNLQKVPSPLHVFQSIIPAVVPPRKSAARLDRQLAALSVVEAIRLYAAGHDGQLPQRLDQITDVAQLDDPFTGKPFEYRCDGETSHLVAQPPAGDKPAANNTLRYELKIAKP